MSALIRVGHKGADAIVAGNTLASFDAALAAGVDMIEFDVLAERRDGSGELFVAHDHPILAKTPAPTLTQALAHLTSPPFDGVRLQLDIKQRGYEQRVIDALTQAGALERAFISTGIWNALQTFRQLAPALRTGWTVPAIVGVSGTPLISPSFGRLYSRLLPRRAAARIRAGQIDALVPNWRVVTPALVDAVLAAGGEIYVWTVDDAAQISLLAEQGVTGVITNDPRLFATLS
ncbi:MAG: glycerophosphodiester phosphodiesterase, partial [Solirubrobacteraceae bacterium]|jgi:glycerophosphoryl diester phosphodiesterase